MNPIIKRVGDNLFSYIKTIWSFIIQFFPRVIRSRELVWITVFLFYFGILVFDFLPSSIEVAVGQVAPEDIISPRTMEFIDAERTEQLRDQAVKEVKPVYEFDTTVELKAISDIARFFDVLEKNRARNFAELKLSLPVRLKDDTAKKLFSLGPDEIYKLRSALIQTVRSILNKGISSQSLNIVDQLIQNEVSGMDIPQKLKDLTVTLARYFIRPNLSLNMEETIRRQNEARNSVPPVKYTVLKGQVIVRKGDIVTREHVKYLDALGLTKREPNILGMVGLGLIVLLSEVVIIGFIESYLPDIYTNVSLNWLVAILMMIGLVLVKGFSLISVYLIPLATISILATVLLDYRISIIISIFSGLLPNISNPDVIRFYLPAFIGSIVGILSAKSVTQRGDLTRAGLFIGLSQIFSVGAVSFMGYSDIRSILLNVGYGAGAGILSAIFAIGLMPYLEHLFQIVTSIRLTELTNFTQPLLKRLMLEAPGTYHHSILIGNLAEAAGEALNANLPLLRAGAYYHDVGKIRRPYFFIENQIGGENLHDKLSPNLSRLIILQHVDDGVMLARQYKIPEQIIDFIREHHGTSLVSYFYYQAMKENPDNVKEEDYRYKGPKPRSKETAIVMLADAVEAAVRSLSKPSPQKIEETVRGIVMDRLNDRQLDDSPLTLRDLDVIIESFIKVLNGIFHPRIEYPETQREVKPVGARSS
ncbi:TPA: HDIG domain-containing protein [bacterium]|nr:HDIG domain-containing protein [bacterium]